MVYGYVRVSTNLQDNENQKFEIRNYCKRNQIKINQWIEETVSGGREVEKRKLGELVEKLKPNDTIIATEISRLGRSLLMVMSLMKALLEKEIKVITIKDNYRLDDSMTSKVLAFAFGLAAEIERDLLRRRVKEALSLRKQMGVRLGRPPGAKNKRWRLEDRRDEIVRYLEMGYSQRQIAQELNVHTSSLRRAFEVFDIDPWSYEKLPKRMPRRGSKLENKKEAIKVMRDGGMTRTEMCKILNCHYLTLSKFLARSNYVY